MICNDNLIQDSTECCFFLHKELNKGDEEHDCSRIVYTTSHDIVLRSVMTFTGSSGTVVMVLNGLEVMGQTTSNLVLCLRFF